LVVGLSSAAVAQDFPAQVVLKISNDPASSWDIVGRLTAPYLQSHLPGNPAIAIENVPAASGMQLSRQMVTTEPTDGSVVGMVPLRAISTFKTDPSKLDFDPTGLRWVASLAAPTPLCVAKKGSGLKLTDPGITLGTTTKTSSFYVMASIAKLVSKNDFRIVAGFEGEGELMAAVERGEINAYCGITYSTFLREGRGEIQDILGGVGEPSVLAKVGAPDLLAGVDGLDRQAIDLLTSGFVKFYAFALPPGTPDEVLATYRTAFAELAKDEAYLAELNTKIVDYLMTDGEALDAFVNGIYGYDEAVVTRALELTQ
jgi:tripartite-type tricarboxylate transporter receptor subunit TctC